MKLVFDNLSLKMSKATTQTYSTSFSLGIYLLNRRLRNAMYSIYGFVRLADEIVDSFDGYNQAFLLQKFKEDTYESLEKGISLNPILNSFQQAVRRYNINQEHIDTFLKSMEMDLKKINYTEENYRQYILGSAEVVGLMCLHVFTEGDMKMYEELKPYAMKLGAAFQKVNFLRDIKADFHLLGRTYFPGSDISNFSGDTKKRIENEIENDFRIALEGIKKLPASSRCGVYLAYAYYHSLFSKIKKLPAKNILQERVRINNGKKLGLMINSMILNKLNLV